MARLPVAHHSPLLYHQSMRGPDLNEIIIGLVRVTILVVLAWGVYRVVRRVPLPARGSRLRFALIHVATAAAAIITMFILSDQFNRVLLGGPTDGRLDEYALIGSYLYVVIAGVSYAIEERGRAGRAEAAAAQMQLSALRAQIQPHFLFNALHAVVQLIPIDPARAMDAAELVAELLRTTMEDDRDVISLREEWSFVSRYLELERIRFGDRLRVHANVDDDLLDFPVPSFALQTLVENAVRHGAAPRIEPTDIVISASGTPSQLTLTVRNPRAVASTNGVDGTGTGLNRLRDRLVALHGNAARLTSGDGSNGEYEAVVVVPRTHMIEER